MQNCRVDREQEKESRDIQNGFRNGLGGSAVMAQEKGGWREKSEEMCSRWCFREISPAAESGESSEAVGLSKTRRGRGYI